MKIVFRFSFNAAFVVIAVVLGYLALVACR